MKSTLLLALSLAALAGLAPSASAQNAPVPRITSIPARKSWNPGNLVVYGSNLGLAFDVTLDDVPLPIVRNTGFRISAGPLTPRDPGFGSVEVIGGGSVAHGTVEFVPNLMATQRGLRLTLRLNNGEPGTYVVRYSYSPSSPVADAGIFNLRHLPALANVLYAGVFVDDAPVTITGVTVPFQIGLIGVPLRMQALCHGSTSGSTAYTNLAVTAGFGKPKGP